MAQHPKRQRARLRPAPVTIQVECFAGNHLQCTGFPPKKGFHGKVCGCLCHLACIVEHDGPHVLEPLGKGWTFCTKCRIQFAPSNASLPPKEE